MKNGMNILVPVLALALAVGAGDPAQAGLFGRGKQKNREREAKTWRYDHLPTMNFVRGTLSRDGLRDWQVGGVQVQLTEKCRVVDGDGEEAQMSDGAEVMIMGPRVGGTVVAWQIRVLDASYLHASDDSEKNIAWREVDPTLGEGTGPN